MLDAAMKRYRFAPDALIEVLHRAQELFGYLQPDLLYYIAHGLKLPPSRVYGVASFYHLFSVEPKGEHTCVVCMGTACFVKGADQLLRSAEECAGVKTGETRADKSVSLLTARCIGACGIAPVVVYDKTVAGKQTAKTMAQRLQEWL